MTRKSWSRVFFAVGGMNAALGMMPANPWKIVDWVILPCCLICGAMMRRTMISKPIPNKAGNDWHLTDEA